MADHETRAFYANVDDPQGTEPIQRAYCVLVEVHLNYELQATIGVFQCWRSKSAYEAGREAFSVLQAKFAPDEGGKLFFNENADIAEKLGQALRDHSVTHSSELQGAIQHVSD